MSDVIRQVEIYHAPVKLKEPFIISLGALEYADNVIVVIHSSDGITGYGECSPFQTIHGENGETCMAVGKILAQHLLGKEVNAEKCSLLMDKLIYGNTSIKSAFDIALFDISSKRKNLPLYKFLGGKNRVLTTDYTISFSSPEKMAKDAAKIISNGFKIIKVKLGGTEEDDLFRIKKIREVTGNEIPLRIDANQGWSVDLAKRILPRLEQFNIQHCEEPVHRSQYIHLKEIRTSTSIPVMADESCFDHLDAERLINLDACSMMNIKLGKSSGIHKALKIVSRCERAGISMQMGGFLESRLGFSAAAHFALCSEKIEHIDFDTPLMFSEDFIEGGIIYSDGGAITVPDLPGTGATIAPGKLQTLNKIIVR